MKVFLCFACVLFFTELLSAREYCSLVVKVVDEQGTEVSTREPVVVEESDGKRIEKRYMAGGVSFCDLGILPVTVTVGAPGSCNQTSVRNVPLGWLGTTTIQVNPNVAACRLYHSLAQLPGCDFFFRFINSKREPIPNVSVNVRNPGVELLQGDSFGRVWLRILLRDELIATATANGYDPVEIKYPCPPLEDLPTRDDIPTLQQYVTMRLWSTY